MLKFKISQNDVKAWGSPEQLRELRQYLTVRSADGFYVHGSKGRPGRFKTSSIKFFGAISHRFAYGLWGHVKFFLKENGLKYEVTSNRKSLSLLDSKKLGGVELYGLQVDSANAWFEAGGSGIVWGAPGFGKTEVACAIMNQMLKRQYVTKILFIVNGLDLLDQAAERIKLRLGYKVGQISGGNVQLNKIITVAAIQKLHGLIKNKDPNIFRFLQEIDFLVYDEIHHARSNQTVAVIRNCPAKYRLGVSARPLRIDYKTYKIMNLDQMKADDARVIANIGPIVKRVPASQLIKLGKLAKPRIYLYSLNYDDFIDPHSRLERMKWLDAKKRLIIDNRVIHRVAAKQAVEAAKAGQTTMAIAGGSRRLGLNIYSLMKDANLNVVYLHGGIDKRFRSKSRTKMSRNRLEACVATTIYDEGIDIPNLRQLILAYGGLSPIKNEQRFGRGIRNKIGTNEAVIVDFMNYGNRHLRKHSYARLKMYTEEDAYSIKLVGPDHPPHVKRLVGKDNIVRRLPRAKLFRSLKNGKHKKINT